MEDIRAVGGSPVGGDSPVGEGSQVVGHTPPMRHTAGVHKAEA